MAAAASHLVYLEENTPTSSRSAVRLFGAGRHEALSLSPPAGRGGRGERRKGGKGGRGDWRVLLLQSCAASSLPCWLCTVSMPEGLWQYPSAQTRSTFVSFESLAMLAEMQWRVFVYLKGERRQARGGRERDGWMEDSHRRRQHCERGVGGWRGREVWIVKVIRGGRTYCPCTAS